MMVWIDWMSKVIDALFFPHTLRMRYLERKHRQVYLTLGDRWWIWQYVRRG